ncbi:MAG: AAA family ATPase [Blastocatellia bacterium]|nr:AAA family ATPase [Blastocatellia bacterium]
MNRSILPKSTFELLKGDENSFLYLYVGRIIKFLSESVRKIDQLKEKQNLENTNMLNEDDLSEEAQTSFDDTNTSEFVGEVAGELVLEEIEKTEDEENQRLFLEALLAMESPLNKKILGLMKTVLQFLWARLRVMRVCISIYAGDHVDFAGSFKALSESYSSLLKFRISLLTSQKRKCEITTQTLNKGEMGINIYTKEADQIIHKHQNSIQKISEISSLFEEILQFNPQNKMRELYDLVENYDLRTRYILDKVFSLSKQETQNMFFFSPVEVELRQGKGYRAFHQLSFGQKSGIILKMVLMIPSKHVIIIDQPEDNLDVASIVNMLAPTLQELAKDHQVVIATHSSNLVMGLSGGDLVVLESIGDYGRIKERGSLFKDRQVIREMLDILEGGAETINQKMELYEKFISRVKGAIEDIDIMTIESSFRRRTIDELRNFLQPIISDKALLDFVRHELNQSDYIRIQQNIHDTKQETLLVQCSPDQPLDSLFTKLNKLCTELDKHIIKLKGIIEEIRLMDTQPNFTYVDIYLLLIILRNDYIDKMFGSKFGRKVDITIDSSFQGVLVYADYDHLRLIFRNLLNNALRATESRAIAMKKKSGETLVESIIIEGVINSTNRLVLKFKDNGCGMALEIRKKLYLERCSTKKFGDHGLGGIIIKKLLNINHGSIQILESNQNGSLVGTEQEISLLIHITDLPVK